METKPIFMAGISKFDEERMSHINFVTNDLYDGVTCIFEAMADRDYPNLKKIIKTMSATLKGILESIEEEA